MFDAIHARLRQNNHGFTLIELCVVIIITGFMMVAAIGAYTVYQKRSEIILTQNNLAAAEGSIQGFLSKYGYYPCPARASAKPADSDYGIGQNCAAISGNVVSGVIPMVVRNPAYPGAGEQEFLSVSPAYNTIDAWKQKISYTVTKEMAMSASSYQSATAGNRQTVKVKDLSGGTPIAVQDYFVFSPGPDGKGAYMDGVQVSPCSGSQADTENCNGDDTFSTSLRSTASGNTHFDDFVRYTNVSKVCPEGRLVIGVNGNGSPICSEQLMCSSGQIFTGIDSSGQAKCQNIAQNCANDQVMVSFDMDGSPVCVNNFPGSCPQGQVQTGTDPKTGNAVCMNIMYSCPMGQVQVGTEATGTPICTQNFSGNCPEAQVQIGTDYSSGNAICRPVSCPPGEVVVGLASGQTVCRAISQGSYCPEGQVMKGINADGTAICGVPPSQNTGLTAHEYRMSGDVVAQALTALISGLNKYYAAGLGDPSAAEAHNRCSAYMNDPHGDYVGIVNDTFCLKMMCLGQPPESRLPMMAEWVDGCGRFSSCGARDTLHLNCYYNN